MLVLLMIVGFIVAEGLVEYLLGTVFDKVKWLAPYKWLLMFPAAAVGIYVALVYQLDIIHIMASEAGLEVAQTNFGFIATGVFIGRGGNFVNDLWAKFFPSAGSRG